MKCKHDYEPPGPNRYQECLICGEGRLLEPGEFTKEEQEDTKNQLAAIYGGP